jgi:hypothetical protein
MTEPFSTLPCDSSNATVRYTIGVPIERGGTNVALDTCPFHRHFLREKRVYSSQKRNESRLSPG